MDSNPSPLQLQAQASPSPPDHSASMFHNATIDKAERSEFSNTARDMFKFVLNYHNSTGLGSTMHTGSENPAPEFHDAINYLLSAVPLFVEEVRKNDQSRSTVAESSGTNASDTQSQVGTTDNTPCLEVPVDVIDIIPPEPCLLPVANIADRYTRSMLKCLVGYPLYDPKPFSEFSKDYLRKGINIGDVGFVRGNGTFDFLFNICPSQNGLINPPHLPDSFSLETPDHSGTRDMGPLLRNTSLFQSPLTKTRSGEYVCEGSEGAVLELPEGATQDEATNIRPFEKLAARHGVKWYEYTMNRGRKISNGSLYLITSFTKCAQWGIAVFDRPCGSGQGLRFEKKRSLPFGKSNSKYHWKGSGAFSFKASDLDKGDDPNQSVFIRGYKIMIRQDIFDTLCNDQPRGFASETPSMLQAPGINMTRQPATRIRGGGGPDLLSRLTLTSASASSRTITTESYEKVVLHPNFNSLLIHPSDLINAALLSQNQNAKVALTHDDVWCDLLRNNFPKYNDSTLINIARSYTTIIKYDSISLAKLPYSTEVVQESSYPLQGCEITAVQSHPLTPHDDNYTPVHPTISLTLPRELVEKILSLTDAESMLTCRLVNREFNEIIQSSAMLQYFLACKVAGVIDNPRSPLSCTDRLAALRMREAAWKTLMPVFEKTIQINDQLGETSLIYELTAGNYFLVDANQKYLYHCHLPLNLQDDPHWNNIPGDGPGQSWSGSIVDFGMAIYEHDLIVNVISTEVGQQAHIQRHSLDLVLLKFSTREYHPLASHSRIHVLRSDSPQHSVTLRIVGDNLALVVQRVDDTFHDKLFIFDWKTGYKRLQHEARAYFSLDFVSPEFLLVPNLTLPCFEVWYLPPIRTDNPPVQILSFGMPTISDDYSIDLMDCHAEPSPFLRSMPYFPPRSFFPSPEDSIIVVYLYLLSLQQGDRSAYALVMRRRELLDTIRKCTSPFLEEQHLPCTTNRVTVCKTDDLDNRLVWPTESTTRNLESSPWNRDSQTLTIAQISPTFPSSNLYADSGSSSISSESPTVSSTSRYNIRHVQWEDWGPPISRWFPVNELSTFFLHQSNGQRLVFMTEPRDRRIYVADFNPHIIRENTETAAHLGLRRERKDKEGIEDKKKEELEILDHGGVFLEEVYMGLKCVVSHVPGEYDFDSILIDEERLLGLKLDNTAGRQETITVFYFG